MPKTSAFSLSIVGRDQLREAVKYQFLILFGHANSLINDLNTDLAVVDSCPDRHLRPGGRKLRRIGQHVCQHLHQALLVTIDMERVVQRV